MEMEIHPQDQEQEQEPRIPLDEATPPVGNADADAGAEAGAHSIRCARDRQLHFREAPHPLPEPTSALGELRLTPDEERARQTRLDAILDAMARPRGEVPSPDKALSLQFLDGEYSHEGYASAEDDAEPVIRVYGVTAAGGSVLVHLHGFEPYFYTAPPAGLEVTTEVHDCLCAALGGAVRRLEEVERTSLMNYAGSSGARTLLRVVVNAPRQVMECRRILEAGVAPATGAEPVPWDLFEANCDFVLRWMVDHSVVGCCWLSLKAGEWRPRTGAARLSCCSVEVDADVGSVVAHDPNDPAWEHHAPARILSFDIECLPRAGAFPKPEADPVLQIACRVEVHGSSSAVLDVVLTLDTCSAISGAEVLSYATEEDLLRAFTRLVVLSDPDVLTGYNIIKFDLVYLLERAEALLVGDFPTFGRVFGRKVTARDKTFESKQSGKRDTKEIRINGRVLFDMLDVMVRDEKLSSYSLNSVSRTFLGEQKEDVQYTEIPALQRGGPNDRRRMASYCRTDAALPLRLLRKMMKFVNYVEMARTTTVPLAYLLTRGQQIRVYSQLLRKAQQRGFAVPTLPPVLDDDESKFEGATVIEPETGLHRGFIATLDFASLYPSIIQAHNLCYTTLLRDEGPAVAEERVSLTPDGSRFVTATERRGLLPQILEELLGARKHAKRQMKQAKERGDEIAYAIYDGKQLALKVSANSVRRPLAPSPPRPLASSTRRPFHRVRSSTQTHGSFLSVPGVWIYRRQDRHAPVSRH